MKTASEIFWSPSVGSPGLSGASPNTGTGPDATNGIGPAVVGGRLGNVVDEDGAGFLFEVVDVVELEDLGVVVDVDGVDVVVVDEAAVGDEVLVDDVVDPPDGLGGGGTVWPDAPPAHNGQITRTMTPTVSVATKARTLMVPNISPPTVRPHEK